jgi:restriction system protein
MTIPDFQTLMLPTLRLATAGEVRVRDLVGRLATEFGLTEDDLAERLPSGRQTTIVNRVSWAVIYLTKAGLLGRMRRGVYTITDRGRTVLANPPPKIDIRFLSQFEGFDAFRTGSAADEEAVVEPTPALAAGTPDERIEAAFEDLNAALRNELIERVRTMDPTSFEKLIIDLMLGMGYGAGGSGQHLGRTNDGGVDGVINEDVLGLDIIYLQAKRYAEGNAIGVDKIREFAGSLDERGATKGVFVTTRHFAPQARAYAQRSPKRLTLIDGEELTRLLVRYGVGVRAYRGLQLKRVDTDYFEGLGD